MTTPPWASAHSSCCACWWRVISATGSRWARASLSRDSGLNLSSATIRNVMADLEELGFVTSPHTSAGRIPTAKGYRFFVDTLLKVRPFDGPEAEAIRRGFDRAEDPRALVATASQLLSSLTQMAGLVTLPTPQSVAVTPHRVPAAVREPRARDPGGQRSRGPEPHPAGAA